MAESEVGIETFLADNSYIEATIKHRLTDFIVEEINIEGHVEKFNVYYRKGSLKRTRIDMLFFAKSDL